MNKLKNINILYLIKTMDLGGAERYTLNLCKYFIDKFNSISVFSSGGLFTRELEKLGVINFIDELAKDYNLFNIFKLRKRLKKIIIQEKINIIHCHHRVFVIVLSTLRLKNIKIVYTAHNNFNDIFQKLLFPNFAVAVSEHIYQNLITTIFVNKNNIIKINTGIKLKNYHKVQSSNPVFGYIGRIIKEKGIYIIIEAFKKFYKKNQNAKLIIIGAGTEIKNINKLILADKLFNNIIIKNPSNDLNEIYSLVDIILLPSIMNEGLSLVLLEAMSFGKIVIASDIPATQGFIEDNINGFLVGKKDIQNLVSRMKYVYDNYNSLNYIIFNALNSLKEKYSLENWYNSYQTLYTHISESIILE